MLACTLDQVSLGTWGAVEIYMRAWVVWRPLPGVLARARHTLMLVTGADLAPQAQALLDEGFASGLLGKDANAAADSKAGH